MACQFNANFTFDNKANISYKDTTAPLRMLLRKDQKFKWEKEEDAYQLQMRVLEDPARFQSYTIERDTDVTNGSEHGIQGSIYQEKDQPRFDEKNIWVPIGHVSNMDRSLTSVINL